MVVSQAQAAHFLAPGSKLGKYALIRQIAVGGMAEIYLARTLGIEGFEKLVVVKRILPQFAAAPGFVKMFLDEARLAATLHHANIAQVYDIGVDGGSHFFSMEYVHGEDLRRMIAAANDQGVPVSLDATLTLVAGVCAGLHHAHQKTSADGAPLGIVHRDVSPSNVLVSYDGGVKVVDFGIARATSRPSGSAPTGGLKGKIAYMSPEQCRGNAQLDRRSDIFSIGSILYELSTGTLPFYEETEYGILNRIVNEDVEPPSRRVPLYPAALEAIVLRAMARDPAKRYATAVELQKALEDFAHDTRLRISPLTLGRLMGSLFPAALAEWERAVTQGAYFVEQHVVKTLVGKTGEYQGELPVRNEDRPTATRTPILADDEKTDIVSALPVPPRAGGRPAPSQRAPTELVAPLPSPRPSPPPAGLRARPPGVPTPPPGTVPPLPPARATTPPPVPTAAVHAPIVQQTARVRVPEGPGPRSITPDSEPTEQVSLLAAPYATFQGSIRSSKRPLAISLALLVVAAGVAAAVILTGQAPTGVAPEPTAAPVAPAPVAPAQVAPAPAAAAPAPVAPAPTDPEAATAAVPPPIAPAEIAPAVAPPEDTAVAEPEDRPPAKASPPRKGKSRSRNASRRKKSDSKKEKQWSADSIFMPVPDK